MQPEAKAILDKLHAMRGQPDANPGQRFNEFRNKRPEVTDFSDSQWTGIQTGNVQIDLKNLDLRRAKFVGCEFVEGRFNESNLTGAGFFGCQLGQSHFQHATLDLSRFDSSDAIGWKNGFSNTDAKQAYFTNLNANQAKFNCLLNHAQFSESRLVGTVFDGSDLSRTVFNHAYLENASFLNVTVTSGTSFTETTCVTNCRIDRYALACLGDKFGGLTPGNRMDMIIVDDVVRLRSQFGGIWRLLHLFSIVLFVFPYAYFLATQWVIAKFHRPTEDSITLLEALIRFVLRGGKEWRTGWFPNWSFALFLFYCLYNALRFALLWKTSALETKEIASGLPARFSLEDESKGIRFFKWRPGTGVKVWKLVFQAVRWGVWLSFLAMLANTIHFLMQRIPFD